MINQRLAESMLAVAREALQADPTNSKARRVMEYWKHNCKVATTPRPTN
jgi:hypothetical protein